MTGVAFFDIDSFQLEEGVVATEYERPAPAYDYPIEVHNLNDFDVVSSAGKRNIILNSSEPMDIHSATTGLEASVNSEGYYEIIASKDNGNWFYPLALYQMRFSGQIEKNFNVGDVFTFSVDIKSPDSTDVPSLYVLGSTNSGYTPLRGKMGTEFSRFYITSTWADLSSMNLALGLSSRSGTFVFRRMKLEKGSTPTPWIPAQEEIAELSNHPLIDKINILLSEPLRSVGDVKDRLFRDSDGIWKVERNIGVSILNGSETWGEYGTTEFKSNNNVYVSTPVPGPKLGYQTSMTSHLVNKSGIWNNGDTNYYSYSDHTTVPTKYFRVPLDVSISDWKIWLSQNPVTLQCQLATPIIEILSQSLQDKLNNLRSFKGSNYVYTVDNNNLNPNLNVVFKSKGWKHKLATDNLEIDVSNKADRSDVEEGFSDVNESIDEFRRSYESYQDSAAQSMENASNELQKALDRTATIEANLGEGAADWIFTHTQIRMSDEGVTIGQKEAGSYLQISDNQISFFNGSEDPVAFINGGMLHINHAIFVESIQISEFMISSEISGHITFRYVGGS